MANNILSTFSHARYVVEYKSILYPDDPTWKGDSAYPTVEAAKAAASRLANKYLTEARVVDTLGSGKVEIKENGGK